MTVAAADVADHLVRSVHTGERLLLLDTRADRQ